MAVSISSTFFLHKSCSSCTTKLSFKTSIDLQPKPLFSLSNLSLKTKTLNPKSTSTIIKCSSEFSVPGDKPNSSKTQKSHQLKNKPPPPKVNKSRPKRRYRQLRLLRRQHGRTRTSSPSSSRSRRQRNSTIVRHVDEPGHHVSDNGMCEIGEESRVVSPVEEEKEKGVLLGAEKENSGCTYLEGLAVPDDG